MMLMRLLHHKKTWSVCFFRTSGCIKAQRDSDVPLTFTAGRERVRMGGGGRKGEGGTEGERRQRREGEIPQSDVCRTI